MTFNWILLYMALIVATRAERACVNDVYSKMFHYLLFGKTSKLYLNECTWLFNLYNVSSYWHILGLFEILSLTELCQVSGMPLSNWFKFRNSSFHSSESRSPLSHFQCFKEKEFLKEEKQNSEKHNNVSQRRTHTEQMDSPELQMCATLMPTFKSWLSS